MAFLQKQTTAPPMTKQEADARIAEIHRIYAEFETKIQALKKERTDIINTIMHRIDQTAADDLLEDIKQ